MRGYKKATLKNFHTLMFCLMFLVILFDSHIFLLRYADQTNFVMYIIMPKKMYKHNLSGSICGLIFRIPLVYPRLVSGTLLWSATFRVFVQTYSFSYFRYTIVAGWFTTKSSVFNRTLCWKRRGRK